MKRASVVATCLVCVLPFLACGGNDKAPKDAQGKAAVVAFVTVKGTSDINVPVAFTNPSEAIVRYPWIRGSLGFLHGVLYQDGKRVKANIVRRDAPPFTKDQVKELKPGETVTFQYRLPYSEVKPGRYELRLVYEIPPKSVLETEDGLTATKLEQTIILDVQNE
jgi:hypothetical protein